MTELVLVLILLICILVPKYSRGGSTMGDKRYRLSAFKQDEETGLLVSTNYYKAESTLLDAEYTARHMLELQPTCTVVRIYDREQVLKDISRFSK